MFFLETLVVLRINYDLCITTLMHFSNQTTLVEPVKFKGVGLHTGIASEIKIVPAEADQGVIFKRTDLDKNNLIPASYLNVTSAKLCTTLENEFGVKVSTVEHLLAALYIAEIDNAIIEINSEELPIMDGSAKNFLDILKNTEIKTLSKKREFLKVLNKIEIIDGDRRISIEPSDETLEVEFELNYENKIIGKQKNIINLNKDNIEDVYTSRTFCLFKDIKQIKKAGLAKGGSLKNAIVVDDDKILNEGGLRNEKEFVNHKILDLVGDFALSGFRILGKVKCHQGGHQLTNIFLRKLLKSSHLGKKLNFEKFIFPEKFSTKPSSKIAINA